MYPIEKRWISVAMNVTMTNISADSMSMRKPSFRTTPGWYLRSAANSSLFSIQGSDFLTLPFRLGVALGSWFGNWSCSLLISSLSS